MARRKDPVHLHNSFTLLLKARCVEYNLAYDPFLLENWVGEK